MWWLRSKGGDGFDMGWVGLHISEVMEKRFGLGRKRVQEQYTTVYNRS